jgi:phosphoadenosine phosphosulfate reductase
MINDNSNLRPSVNARKEFSGMSRECARLNKRFQQAEPVEILEWAIETYWPFICMSSSFQSQSMPLIHMVTRIRPDFPILFLETGFHFPETLAFKEWLGQEWHLNIVDIKGVTLSSGLADPQQTSLCQTDPARCCYLNKVEPLRSALKSMRAWITGIRREQTLERGKANLVELEPDGVIKINPLLHWTKQDLAQYMQDYDLPEHPLTAQGYRSIGCAPCTRPVSDYEDDRAGRWAGMDRDECGIHTQIWRNSEKENTK